MPGRPPGQVLLGRSCRSQIRGAGAGREPSCQAAISISLDRCRTRCRLRCSARTRRRASDRFSPARRPCSDDEYMSVAAGHFSITPHVRNTCGGSPEHTNAGPCVGPAHADQEMPGSDSTDARHRSNECGGCAADATCRAAASRPAGTRSRGRRPRRARPSPARWGRSRAALCSRSSGAGSRNRRARGSTLCRTPRR
jgi:hypothetical protein